jgi:thiol-disulfide isomerase/thioredoxin
MSRATLFSGLLLAVLSAALGFYLQDHRSGGNTDSGEVSKLVETSVIGITRPGFSLPDSEGQRRNVSEWDGNILVINFWATWCPPCRKEMPMFMELQQQYGGRGLQFIGIATEESDTVIPFINELGINYPILTGTTSAIQIAEQYGNRFGALPYTVIVDRNQQIIYTKTGPVHREDVEAIIHSFL